ncbi:hypothetical protein M569_01600 [Genlisea aurea]|uniref:Uncharacterized protein n=1 Tax=Genlisea aurea TaxID=192259 RepID=S8EB65_9LAMI|nr:hypothetical protein M569_01600 [Genlisea aurea]
MDSCVKSSGGDKSKLARAIAKVLNIDGTKKKAARFNEKMSHQDDYVFRSGNDEQNDEKLAKQEAFFFAGLFAGLSSIKAAYAKLQLAQCPYDPDEIQSADEAIVSELKKLSDLKQLFLKKQFSEMSSSSSETAILVYEVEEIKSLISMYQVSNKKLDSQMKLKDSEVGFLREKLGEVQKEIESLERSQRLFPVRRNAPTSKLNHPSYFATYQQLAVKSIRSFVKVLISGMECADWNLDAAAEAIEPGISLRKPAHKSYAFESFVSRVMFDGFNHPNFFPSSNTDDRTGKQAFLEEFLEMKNMNSPAAAAAERRNSGFPTFYRKKYTRLMNPKMESSLFGNMDRWNTVSSGGYPEEEATPFFSSFIEMAKSIWQLHCLAFAFQPAASVFRANRGSRFSEVWMEGVNAEAFTSESDPQAGFTVFPGFRIDSTVIQCQVYLC